MRTANDHATQDLGRSKLQTLAGLLRSWGYDDKDFVIEEDRSEELANLFGLSGGVVKVTRRSTGECRMYATGIESAWISSLLLDLARGHLADGPETAPAPLIDTPVQAERKSH
ncbi:hypothetical protein [Rhizobacter sp. Root1221]|uniref:hypothetical protein n=1 Tax=Rhizobacter sp. Root1221 TaxID=1736433 RepID=UPI0007001A98|nr:hypothetical protein [Rhizobacter sp. Root1221]KQW03127.1 hypothetical protein ASC87_02000 [Rhizobacter sp. Root1221]